MLDYLIRTLHRFRRDEGGNMFILFGACAIPMILIMGGAVDFSRFTRYKHELTNAVDASALALARQQPNATEDQGKEFVRKYVEALAIADSRFSINTYTVNKIDDGFRVVVNATMQTLFLPLGRFTAGGSGTPLNSMTTDVVAEVTSSSSAIELAMVLDVTGSMNCGDDIAGNCVGEWANPSSSSRIVALRSAANKLLDVLMPAGFDPNTIKIGVVPFEGTVNVGSTYAANPPSWVDWNYAGAAYWNGRNFDKVRFANRTVCTTGADCVYVGHRTLFEQLGLAYPAVKWEGCVEMRNAPYDVLDTTPSAATPDTLFVPFFVPDEPDSFQTKFTTSPDTRLNANYTTSPSTRNSTNWDYSQYFANNYLADTIAVNWDASPSRPLAAQAYPLKYQYISPSNKAQFHTDMLSPSTTFPFRNGPNRGCTQGLVPLTNNKSTVSALVSNLVAYPSMGTYIPVGLVWGWHMLTANEPLSQGVAASSADYRSTTKALLLFTDGDNNGGLDYNSYNYARQGRIGTTAEAATAALNAKTAELCNNIKNWDPSHPIRVYTITFGSISDFAKTLMSNCATSENGRPLYYHTPSTSDLDNIFRQIAQDLAGIHLSQ